MRRSYGRNFLWNRITHDVPHAESSMVCILSLAAGVSDSSASIAVATAAAQHSSAAAAVAADLADIAIPSVSVPAVAAAAVADPTAHTRRTTVGSGATWPGDVMYGAGLRHSAAGRIHELPRPARAGGLE